MSESELVEKGLPCDECGSSDAVAQYDDGHTYCFSCKHTERNGSVKDPTKPTKPKKPFDEELAKLIDGAEARALPKWGIQQATTRHWDYLVKELSPDKGHHIAIYRNEDREAVFAKVRVVSPENPKLDFFGIGDQSQVSLWGVERLGKGGKMVVVCEGEKDTLTCSQLWGNKFPVVGLPFGAESSDKAFARALPLLGRFDKVVLALDMDKQGRDGALSLAKMLPPGKAFIAEFPEHDLTDTVQKLGAEVATRAIHQASPYTPDGIVDADDFEAEMLEAPSWGFSLPYPDLDEWTYGMKPGQVWVLGGGVGIGKSDQAAEIVAKHIAPPEDGGNYQRAAIFNYESDGPSTLKLVLSKLVSKRFTVPNPKDGSANIYWNQEDLLKAIQYRHEKCAKLYINDHKGAVSWDAVKERIRYLKHSAGISLAIVDPVAALVATEDDKNTALDKLFAEAKMLAEELGITIMFFSHLARPKEGKGHEEGGRVTMAQFRGSNSITMWADVVCGFERDQQAEDEDLRCKTVLRMLKIRKAGEHTGKTLPLMYNVLNGRLEEFARPIIDPQPEGEDVEPPPV